MDLVCFQLQQHESKPLSGMALIQRSVQFCNHLNSGHAARSTIWSRFDSALKVLLSHLKLLHRRCVGSCMHGKPPSVADN
jgi:hypothetical protein